MKFDLSKINFSRNDVRSNVKIPLELTPELAEFIGIMVGDGYICAHVNNNPNPHIIRYIEITGNINDKGYYINYVNPLIFKIFNIIFNLRIKKEQNCIIISKGSKAIYSFLKKIIGLPSRKNNISIPKVIMRSSKEIKTAFLRGLFDADGCLTIKNKPNPYPVIKLVSKSERLIQDVSQILEELKIQHYFLKEEEYYTKRNRVYTKFIIYLNGRKRVKTYLEIIGFSNKNKINKYKEFLDKE